MPNTAATESWAKLIICIGAGVSAGYTYASPSLGLLVFFLTLVYLTAHKE